MLDGIPIGDLSPAGLLGIAIILIFTGGLVPRWVYKGKVSESEKWHTAYELERQARAASDKQTDELLEVAKTTHSLIVAVFSNSERIRQSGETDANPKA